MSSSVGSISMAKRHPTAKWSVAFAVMKFIARHHRQSAT